MKTILCGSIHQKLRDNIAANNISIQNGYSGLINLIRECITFIKIPVMLIALQLDFMSIWLYLLYISIFQKQLGLLILSLQCHCYLKKHGSILRFSNLKSTGMRKLNRIMFVRNGTYLELLYNNSLGLPWFINTPFI